MTLPPGYEPTPQPKVGTTSRPPSNERIGERTVTRPIIYLILVALAIYLTL